MNGTTHDQEQDTLQQGMTGKIGLFWGKKSRYFHPPGFITVGGVDMKNFNHGLFWLKMFSWSLQYLFTSKEHFII